MLTLEPPFYFFSGIAVFRDHAIPKQFFYSAPNPVIATQDGRTIFDLMIYAVDLKHSVLSGTSIPDELGAGFLTMATECPLSPAQRSAILDGLQGATGLPQDQIQLFPIPYHKGTVSVLALDQYKSPAGEPDSAASETRLNNRPTFVEEILGSGKPSLLGDLRTIFSLSLSQNGAAFMQNLYANAAAPVGVVYELNYYGLRPSVEARVHADLSRIYTHFGGSLGVQYKWLKVEVDAALEYLREQHAVEVELISQAVGDAAEKAKERAMALFKEDIIQNLFRPTVSTQPTQPTPNLTHATGTVGSTASLTLSLQYKRQEELKQATYEYSERAPEERTHSPQGFMPVMLSPSQLQQHIHSVSLNSPFFELLEVLVSGPPKEEFEALGIRQIEATLTYGEPGTQPGEETRSVVFRPDSTGDKTVAFQRKGRKSLAYSLALTYDFLREGADSDSFSYQFAPVQRTGRSIAINPSADFGVLEVEVEAGRVHSDVSQVDVDLAYNSPDGNFNAKEHFRLTPGQPPANPLRWLVRTRTTDINPYTATFTFTLDDGAWTAPPFTSTDRLLEVDTPFVAERGLTIQPAVSPGSTVECLIVEVEYDDLKANYRRYKVVEFRSPFSSAHLTWPILDRDKQTLRYRVAIQEAGMVSEGDWENEEGPSIIVGALAHTIGRVKVQLLGPSLDTASLDGVEVRFLPIISGQQMGSPDVATNLLFDGTKTSDTVDLTLPPGEPLKYCFQTISFRKDGTQHESDWKESSNTLLILQVVNL
jgi:hypothetical protein